jgi:pre-mRNA-splicing factor CWC26
MSLADYLAKHYLNADSNPDKKTRKRKRKDGSQAGLIIADDDVLGWNANGDGHPDEEAPLTGTARSPLSGLLNSN